MCVCARTKRDDYGIKVEWDGEERQSRLHTRGLAVTHSTVKIPTMLTRWVVSLFLCSCAGGKKKEKATSGGNGAKVGCYVSHHFLSRSVWSDWLSERHNVIRCDTDPECIKCQLSSTAQHRKSVMNEGRMPSNLNIRNLHNNSSRTFNSLALVKLSVRIAAAEQQRLLTHDRRPAEETRRKRKRRYVCAIFIRPIIHVE